MCLCAFHLLSLYPNSSLFLLFLFSFTASQEFCLFSPCYAVSQCISVLGGFLSRFFLPLPCDLYLLFSSSCHLLCFLLLLLAHGIEALIVETTGLVCFCLHLFGCYWMSAKTILLPFLRPVSVCLYCLPTYYCVGALAQLFHASQDSMEMNMGCSHFSQGDEKVHLCYSTFQPFNIIKHTDEERQVFS